MVETYPYGMIPYSCYTASSYPTATITISVNGAANLVYATGTTTQNIIPFYSTTPPTASANYKVTV